MQTGVQRLISEAGLHLDGQIIFQTGRDSMVACDSTTIVLATVATCDKENNQQEMFAMQLAY